MNLSVERQKARRRHVWLVPAAILVFLLLWILWSYQRITAADQSQGYSALLFQIPVMNTILMPLMIAVIASRICDMEIKGNTLKMWCTMETFGTVYNCKLLFSMKYLFFLCAGEVALIVGTGCLFRFTEKLRFGLMALHLVTTFLVGTSLMILQQTLSLLSDNQLLPLIVGLAGSFLGLFSIYFPEKVSQFVLWSYFCAFTPLRMDWDRGTRVVTYYDIPFPGVKFAVFLVFTGILYVVGKKLFERKEL